MFHNSSCVLCRSNIRQSPSRLELKFRIVHTMYHLNENRYNTCIHNFLGRRIRFLGKMLTNLLYSIKTRLSIVRSYVCRGSRGENRENKESRRGRRKGNKTYTLTMLPDPKEVQTWIRCWYSNQSDQKNRSSLNSWKLSYFCAFEVFPRAYSFSRKSSCPLSFFDNPPLSLSF